MSQANVEARLRTLSGQPYAALDAEVPVSSRTRRAVHGLADELAQQKERELCLSGGYLSWLPL
jgi:hypothetical protein